MSSLREGIYSLGRLSLSVVMAILASVFLAAGVCAQVDASLWGSVNDTSGAGIPGATIAIRNLETGKERILTTDESGRFNAPALVVGRYEISASKAGFRTDRRTSISAAGAGVHWIGFDPMDSAWRAWLEGPGWPAPSRSRF